MKPDFYRTDLMLNSLFWDLNDVMIESRSHLSPEEFWTDDIGNIKRVIFYMYENRTPMIIAIMGDMINLNIEIKIKNALKEGAMKSEVFRYKSKE